MAYLILVTVLWSFSFSLIGVYLSGQVDVYFAVVTRIALAVAVFLPFLSVRGLPFKAIVGLMGLGASQLGVMYLFYYHSFSLLSVPEILIFTIFTPIYVTLLYDMLEGRFNLQFLAAALLAVVGAAIIRFDNLTSDYILGFFIVQGSNICFAIGQVGYKVLMKKLDIKLPSYRSFGWFYIGALLVTLPAWLLLGGDKYPTTSTQWGILIWLGVGASGLGYFLWNRGATLVNSGTLAVMNNALIPAGLLVNLLLWNKSAPLDRLVLGGLIIMLSLLICKRKTAYTYAGHTD